MKIAIPLYKDKDRVAPHFGTASTVLVVEVYGLTVLRESRHKVDGDGAMETARKLFEIGIGTIICGGIEAYYKNWLVRKGVAVLDNQVGTVREVLAKFLEASPFSKGQVDYPAY